MGKGEIEEKLHCSQSLFVNKYKDLSYQLLAQGDDDVDHLYFILEEDIV